MKYHVLIDGEHHAVTLAPDGKAWLVTHLDDDGKPHGDPVHIDMGVLRDGHAYSLLVNQRSIDIAVEENDSTLSMVIGGGRYDATVLGEREYLAHSIKAEQGDGDKTVEAAMTGIVVEMKVAPGDAVTKGQTLFILEAMKMENEVKAEVDGVVATVTRAAGDTVNLGDVVLEIE